MESKSVNQVHFPYPMLCWLWLFLWFIDNAYCVQYVGSLVLCDTRSSPLTCLHQLICVSTHIIPIKTKAECMMWMRKRRRENMHYIIVVYNQVVFIRTGHFHMRFTYLWVYTSTPQNTVSTVNTRKNTVSYWWY